MINIAELLKYAPKDLELYSPICGHCKLSCILYDDGIRVIAHDVPFRFDKYGRFCSADDAECLLFPSKDCRTWEGWSLPVEPKFKVGSWLYHNSNGVRPVLVTDYDERHGYQIQDESGRYHLSRNLTENEYHLWSIADAKDGDVLVTTKIRNCPFIYRKTSRNNGLAYYYAGVDGDGNFCEDCLKRTLYHFGSVENVVPATKEQRDLLFAKIKEAGYKWDAEKKELRKIQPHYDINNFKPFNKVLVRYYSDENWKCGLFSHLSTYSGAKFVCVSATYVQCIPYNDDTKHLLGTTYMCDERYINW